MQNNYSENNKVCLNSDILPITCDVKRKADIEIQPNYGEKKIRKEYSQRHSIIPNQFSDFHNNPKVKTLSNNFYVCSSHQQINGQLNGTTTLIVKNHGINLENPFNESDNDKMLINNLYLKNIQLEKQNEEQQKQIKKLEYQYEEQQKKIKEKQRRIDSLKNGSPSIINIKNIEKNNQNNDVQEQNNQNNNVKNQNNQNNNGESQNQTSLVLYKEESRKCGYIIFLINLFLDNIGKLGINIYSKTGELLDEIYKPMNNRKSATVLFPTNASREKYFCLSLYQNENEVLHEIKFELRDEKWFQRKKQHDSGFIYNSTHIINNTMYNVHYIKRHGKNENDIYVGSI